MALRAVGQLEFAARLAYLLRHAGVRANALSKDIREKPGYISWLMTQARHVPTELVVPIAQALAGKGDVLNDPTEVAKYLIGLRDDPPLWVARESNPEPTDRWSVVPEIAAA